MQLAPGRLGVRWLRKIPAPLPEGTFPSCAVATSYSHLNPGHWGQLKDRNPGLWLGFFLHSSSLYRPSARQSFSVEMTYSLCSLLCSWNMLYGVIYIKHNCLPSVVADNILFDTTLGAWRASKVLINCSTFWAFLFKFGPISNASIGTLVIDENTYKIWVAY